MDLRSAVRSPFSIAFSADAGHDCRPETVEVSICVRSIRSVYKIGNGPSSSHTVGPYNAARLFLSRYPAADGYEAILYGSLAYTGEGHGTGKAIRTVIPGAKIVPDKTEKDLPHPNTMLFRAFRGGEEIGALRIMMPCILWDLESRMGTVTSRKSPFLP